MGLNVTAMDYRQYDNALGRFNCIDPLAEFGHSFSPYRFGYNNPVAFSDPSGLLEQNNEGLALCPTCPNTPEFKPLIDDPNNTYVYDPETQTASKVIELDEVVVQGKPKAKPKSFYGADVRIISEFWGGGSYFAGGINVPQSMWDGYIKKGLHSYYGRFLMHEYGHFLQNKHGGSFWYMYPAVSSIVNAWGSTIDEHSKHWAEIQASTMSYYYFGFPSGFQEDKNIVMPNYISDELKIELYNGYLNNK